MHQATKDAATKLQHQLTKRYLAAVALPDGLSLTSLIQEENTLHLKSQELKSIVEMSVLAEDHGPTSCFQTAGGETSLFSMKDHSTSWLCELSIVIAKAGIQALNSVPQMADLALRDLGNMCIVPLTSLDFMSHRFLFLHVHCFQT